AASGLHSNGYSLVRRIIADAGLELTDPAPFEPACRLGEVLLEPTRIYVRSLLPLVQSGRIKGLAHITGGGLVENIPRVLPQHCHATVETGGWVLPPVFEQLRRGGAIEPQEMARTFNCGIGMAVIVGPAEAEAVAAALESAGETVYSIGRIEQGARGCTVRGTAGSWGASEAWTATHNG
ncbi:MAG: phosphoribosylformylglycinamidine cyclo-ligase, partial [Sphingomonas sp.]|nr:phosphoribosylformylglycinamidine cyclo-ligase [Sphingomonas sp.]